MAAPDPVERRRLQKLIKRHHGCVSAMVKDVRPKMTHQGLFYRLAKYGLVDEAATARSKHNVPGRRGQLVGGVADAEGVKRKIARLLLRKVSRKRMAEELGISMMVLYRRLRRFGFIESDSADR